MNPRTFLFAAALPFAIACSAPTAATEGDVESSEDELRTSYADLSEALAPADYERWLNVKRALVSGFDNICGDTICSGDYSNLTTVRLGCSATTKTKKLRDCAWTLGGSIEYVNPVTGAIKTDARIFSCKVPVASNAKAMLDTLSAAGDRALQTTLPGTDKSFYDALTDCFSGVVGQPPPASPAGPFVDLQDSLWEHDEAGALAWLATKRQLNASFADVCGDTFCEGDFSDIEGLRLVCAVDTSKNKVRSCSWSFALVDSSINSSGRIVTRSETRTCSVALYVNPSTLTQALANGDPLHTRLPGKTTSLYDALIGCL